MCADTLYPPTQSDRLQAVFDYHQATKHRFEAFASGPGRLDWATQPDPFRRYAGARLIQLETVAPTDAPVLMRSSHPGTCRPIVPGKHASDDIFIDAGSERFVDLLRDPRAAKQWITPFLFDDGVYQFL
jgi:hypothetical protein